MRQEGIAEGHAGKNEIDPERTRKAGTGPIREVATGKRSLRVGACLAAGSPPGTGRAPLNASGSTSDAAEGHILQRGSGIIALVSGVKCVVCPLEHQTQIVPVVVTTCLFGNDVVVLNLRYVRDRQAGDRTTVLLPLQQIPAKSAVVGYQTTKE